MLKRRILFLNIMSLVPWGKLETATLATVAKELGLASYTSRTARKHELVRLLQSVELEGCESTTTINFELTH